MTIELFGLPASGKSTYAKELKEKGGYQAASVKGLTKALFLNLLFLLSHPIKFFQILWHLISYSKTIKIFKLNLLNSFIYRNAKWQKAILKKDTNWILDEAHFQNILSFASKSLTEREILAMCRSALKPSKLIVFTAKAEKRQSILSERGFKGREIAGKQELKEWQESAEHNFELFLKVLPSIGVLYEIIHNN